MRSALIRALGKRNRSGELWLILLVIVIATSLLSALSFFFQWMGERSERALVYEEKRKAIEFCGKDNMTAFVHVETGKIICGGGSYRMLK